MSVIRCDVVAKNKVLFSGELYNVMVPATEGELGIMENHEPFVSALKDGVIWARTLFFATTSHLITDMTYSSA